MARRKTTETAERAARRSSREMLVGQLRKLAVDDLFDVMHDFAGLAPRAAPIAIDAMREGLSASKEGTFVARVSAPDDRIPVPAMAQDTEQPEVESD